MPFWRWCDFPLLYLPLWEVSQMVSYMVSCIPVFYLHLSYFYVSSRTIFNCSFSTGAGIPWDSLALIFYSQHLTPSIIVRFLLRLSRPQPIGTFRWLNIEWSYLVFFISKWRFLHILVDILWTIQVPMLTNSWKP